MKTKILLLLSLIVTIAFSSCDKGTCCTNMHIVSAEQLVSIKDSEGNDLLKKLDTYTYSETETRVPGNYFKMRSYIDGKQKQDGETLQHSSIKITKDTDGFLYLNFEAKIWSTSPIRINENHLVKYEFYCPIVFGDEDYHELIVERSLADDGYSYHQNSFKLDGKDAVLLKTEEYSKIPFIEFKIARK